MVNSVDSLAISRRWDAVEFNLVGMGGAFRKGFPEDITFKQRPVESSKSDMG